MKITTIAAACALLASAGISRATPLEVPEPHSVTFSVTLPQSFTDFTTMLELPQIYPSHFASVTSIIVTLSGTVAGDYSAFNPRIANTYSNQVANIQAAISVLSPVGSGAQTALAVVIPLFSTAPFTLAPRQTVTAGGYDPTGANPGLGITATATNTATTDSTSAGFAAIAQSLVGYGFVDIPIQATGTSSFSGSSNISFNVDTAASASALVTVNYTTIPEPASLALIGAGLAGVALTARRKNASI